MTNQLSTSRVVSVGVNLSALAAQSQSLKDLLILGTGTVIDTKERYRSYSSIAAIAADFGTTAPEYLAAVPWFSQSPQPSRLLVGRWFQAAASGGLRCAPLTAAQQALANFTGIANGSYSISKDGVNTNVAAVNLTGATTLPGIAAILQAASPAGVTCVWNSVYGRFEFNSTSTGAASAISFLNTTGAGTDLSLLIGGRSTSGGYTFTGAVLETPVAAVATFDDMLGQAFYGLEVLGVTPDAGGAGTTALQAVSAYIEAAANKHIFGVTTQEAGALVTATTTDYASVAKAALYNRTVVQYSSTSAYAIGSLLGRILPVYYEGSDTAITLMFKQEPGIVAEQLLASQADALQAKNCNVFVTYNNDTSIIQYGKVASGEYVDTITGTDWLATTVQRDLYNALYTSTTKIPQTEEGMNVLKAVVAARCGQAVANGLCAPGVWNGSPFGQLKTGDYLDRGFYIYSSPISAQSTANRAARMATPIQVAAKLAGAIHTASVTINVNN